MKHQPWFLTVLLVSLVIPSILLSSEIERARVAEVVNRAAGSTLEIPEALSISRDVETEEKCIRLGLGLGPWTDTQPPLFRFYRVVEGAFAIEDGEIVMRSFMLGTPREWVVAIRNSDGKLYRIKGFDGSQSEQPSFSDLVRDLSIKVAVEEDATQTLGFYWFATRGRELRRTILSEMHLRGLATADFAEQCPPRDARKIFRKWWNKGIAGFAKRSRFRMPVVKRNNVFHVQYVFYAQGGVWEETAAVAPNGADRNYFGTQTWGQGGCRSMLLGRLVFLTSDGQSRSLVHCPFFAGLTLGSTLLRGYMPSQYLFLS